MMSLLAPVLLFATICSPPPSLEGPFRDIGFDAARAAARREGKAVLIEFCSGLGLPCRNMDRTTWKDERVLIWLDDRTVPVKIDAEEEPMLAERFRVEADMTLLFVDAAGQECGRLVGYLDPEEFLELAPRVLRGVSELAAIEAALGEQSNRPSLRQRHGELLLRLGRFEGALEELTWCLDYGLKHDPNFLFVRRSSVLSSLAKLGQHYPPALEGLRVRAQAAHDNVLAVGAGGSAAVAEFLQLVHALREPGLILRLWDALEQRPELAVVREYLREETIPLLIQAERNQEALAAAGDVVARVQRRIDEYLERRRWLEDGTPPNVDHDSPMALKRRLQQAVAEGELWVRISAAAGRLLIAEQLASVLIELDSTSRTFAGIALAAAKGGAFPLAEALLARGFATIATDEQFVLRTTRNRVRRLSELVTSQEVGAPTKQEDDR